MLVDSNRTSCNMVKILKFSFEPERDVRKNKKCFLRKSCKVIILKFALAMHFGRSAGIG